MPRTEARISFGLYDITAKPDATYQSTYTQDFVDLADLKVEGFEIPHISSMEPSQTLLDGSFEHIGEVDHTGWWSTIMSNHKGEFGYSLTMGHTWDAFDALDHEWDEVDLVDSTWDEIYNDVDIWDEIESLDQAYDDFDILDMSWDEMGKYFGGERASPIPYMEILFSENHGSTGLTFHFAPRMNEWPTSMNVVWYDQNDEVVGFGDFYPDSALFFAERSVNNYRRILIKFYSTNKPYRFVKVGGIDFGVLQVLTGSDIISAKIHEEISGISAQTIINTLDCQLFSPSKDYYVLNPYGSFQFLQERQQLVAEGIIDGVAHPLGTFYLEELENPSSTIAKIRAVDLMGIIDKTNFLGGIYSNTPANDLINQIMRSAGAPYTLDPSLMSVPVTGHLPICTHREALQQVVFAIGAIATCSRSDSINITPINNVPISNIGVESRFTHVPIKLNDLVTGVSVTGRRYIEGNEMAELLNETLSIGTYTVNFGDLRHSLVVTGAVIVQSNINYAEIRVDVQGQVVLSGKQYMIQTQQYVKNAPDIPSSTAPNIVEISKATLVNEDNALLIAERVYNYYQSRHIDEFTIISTEKVSDVIMTDNVNGGQVRGVIEMASIDLTGGMRMTVKLTGTLLERAIHNYAGELWAGDVIGVV